MSAGITVAILAAGSASRFGGGKLDASAGDLPLGRYALDAVLSLRLGPPVIIVSGMPPAFALAAEQASEALLMLNERASEGLGTSVALAAQNALQAGSNRLLLALADMPLVAAASLRKLIELASDDQPSAARYPDGHVGIPACFPDSLLPQLANLTGDRGAAGLLREHPNTALLALSAGELADVDTPAQLEDVGEALTRRRRIGGPPGRSDQTS